METSEFFPAMGSWYLSKEEIERGSPSRRDGMSAAKESELRGTYCSFIRDVGVRLLLPQITIATAIMLCHRFYLHQSHAKNQWQVMAFYDGMKGTTNKFRVSVDGRGETVYNRLGTSVSHSQGHMSRVWRDMEPVVYLGAATGLCYAAWRYYQYHGCLHRYGRDMTASAGKTDPVIGRDEEIDRIINILCCRTKNCAALVGAAGVGKTAIAEGLAQRIAAGTVPAVLAGARVVEVDLAGIVAGTHFRGMFEGRIKNIIKKTEDADGKVILFIDEMHMILGAGGKLGGNDAANILKPALARGRIRCLGATTFDDYRKYIEKDPALERRFQKVHIEEPSTQATIAILQGLKKRYEEHHGLEIQDAALVDAAQLAARYITECIGWRKLMDFIAVSIGDRQFPDKAIDLIGEACVTATKRMMQIGSQEEEVNTGQSSSVNAVKEAIVVPDHVAQVVSRWTGIPVTILDQEEKDKLIHLADRLHERVVGQDEAVNLVAQAVLRSRTGLDQPGQPIGSFLFVGSTGVGKTELAKALAEQLFDSEKMLVRFDMSEYVSPASVMRLIGAPPSYHGYEDGGQLTEAVKKRPYSVVLFDEVEKADRAVLNVFLQLLDDGVLTNGKGQTVDFKNTIIIMTSNVGAEHLTAEMAGENTTEAAWHLFMKEVQKHFRPELLNRLSDIVVFEQLSQDKLKQIVKIQMKSVVARLADKGISLFATDAVLDVILSESYNPLYGARPIRRWVQKNVMTVLSEMLVKEELREGSTISIDANDDKTGLVYEVVKKKLADPRGQRPVMEIPSDSDSCSDDMGVLTPITTPEKGNQVVRTYANCLCEMILARKHHAMLCCKSILNKS